MTPEDKVLLETIVNYCDTLAEAVMDYNIDKAVLAEKPALCGMAAFFVQQVGECSNKLSANLKAMHPEIEWKAIYDMRNRIAHAYGKIDIEILWDVVQHDIPEFRDFCAGVLQ